MSLATSFDKRSGATPRAHSLLDRYAPLPKKRARKEAPRVQPVVMDDPMAEEFPALLREPPAHAKARNPHESEWHAPPKRPIEVLASARDVIAGMLARRQIDKAMFAAARDYQQVYEHAAASRIKTVDPSMPPISGGRGDGGVNAVATATAELKRIEARLAKTYGAEAVRFVREVLGEGLTVERAATRRGDGDAEGTRWLGNLLRRCLKELAEISGFAVKGAYKNRAREAARVEREERRRERRERHEAKRGKAKPKNEKGQA